MMQAQGVEVAGKAGRVGDTVADRPTPEEHLQAEEKRIKRAALKYCRYHPEWREDIEQEMRIRCVKALELWDPERGPLGPFTWRYMTGSHIMYRIRTLTEARGYRQTVGEKRKVEGGIPQTGSVEDILQQDDGSSAWDDVLGQEDDGYRLADARFDARYIRRLLAQQNAKKGGPPTDLEVMVERIASLGAYDEQAEVAAKHGVSRQAVNQSAHRAIKALRIELGLAD